VIKGKLIIICGLPGSGKTTLAKTLELQENAFRFCADEWIEELSLNLWDEKLRSKIEKLQWKFAETLLANGQSVIIEWGTWSKLERDTLREKAKLLGASTKLIYLSATAEILFERIQKRNREVPPVTIQDIHKWISHFEEPTLEELKLYDESNNMGKKVR
jgi:predicted kinase